MQLLVSQQLKYRMRYLIPEARLEGYDDIFDLLVHLASLKITSPEIFDDNPPAFLFRDLPEDVIKIYSKRISEYHVNKPEVDKLIEIVEKEEATKNLIVSYALVRHFSANRLKKKDEADYYLSKAQAIEPEALPFKSKDLFALERNLRNGINWLRSEIEDRQALKISLSLEKAGSLISIVSGFFIITGYLYNRFLYGEIGIEVSKYFTLSDYLASSIEGIRYSATGAVLGLISCFMGIHHASRKSHVQIEFERRRREYWPYLLFLTALASAISGYILNSEIFYYAIFLLIIMLGMHFVPRVATKYFKEPIMAVFVLVFIVSYSAYMFSSIGKAIYRLKNYPFTELRQYDFKFNENIPEDEANYAFIGASSNYLFFLNKDKEAFIISRENVLYFSRLASEK